MISSCGSPEKGPNRPWGPPHSPHRPGCRRPGASPKDSIVRQTDCLLQFSLLFLKYVLLDLFAVLLMTRCKQLLLIGFILMSLFSSLQYEGCMNVVFIRLWELAKGAISWQELQKLGCPQAMWLKRSGWQRIRSRKKVPLLKQRWKRTWILGKNNKKW